MLVDSGSGDGNDVCNVLTQTGCASGEKCTWIIDMADSTSSVGHIGCAPDGAAAVGATCTRNAPGATGYDDCAKGGYCFGPDMGGMGHCKAICDQAGGTPTCASGFACTTYDGLFGPSGMPVAAGVCDPTCDPLTDNNFLGSQGNNRTTSACGSAGSAAGSGSGFRYNYGCYGYPDGRFGVTKWTCTGQLNYSRIHRAACDTTMHAGDLAACAPAANSVYVNGCAAGYEPTFYDHEGSTTVDCMALCAPAICKNDAGSGAAFPGTPNCATTTNSSANIRGLSGPHNCSSGNVQFATFQNTALAVPPAGSASTAANNGEQCFYSWLFEFDTSNNFIMSPTSDSVGFCVDHSQFKYDPTGGSNANTVWPRCDLIGMGSGFGTTASSDATSFGCVDTATARAAGDLMFNGKASFRRMTELRLPYHRGALKPVTF
jgi:hypothetical protein